MKTVLFFVFAICFFGIVTGQNDDNSDINIIQHQVQPGETVRMLSLKYLATPSDIYKYNKFAIDGIRQGMTLQIPTRRKAAKTTPEPKTTDVDSNDSSGRKTNSSTEKLSSVETDGQKTLTHTVRPGETLSALSRKYNVTVAELQDHNETVLAHGLQAGQKLVIPGQISGDDAIDDDGKASGDFIEHKVEPNETLYSISKKYNVPVDIIKQQNDKLLAQGLKAGQVIRIKPNN